MNSGSTSRRGYGWTHQKLRNRWARDVARGEVDCARCGEPIWPEEPWDLGHVDEHDTVVTHEGDLDATPALGLMSSCGPVAGAMLRAHIAALVAVANGP